MTSRFLLIATTLLLLSGCRQADSPMPTPDEDVQGELGDVKRDLQDVATRREADAAQALVHDLGKYVVRPAAVPSVEELARRTAASLPGRIVSDEAAERLAYSLWVAATARELSESQIEQLQNDFRSQLTSLGVSDGDAAGVATQVGDAQRAVTDRQRRWYEMF